MSDLIPTPGSKWQHYNGAEYTVLHIANGDDNPRYPLSIVYQAPTAGYGFGTLTIGTAA